MEVRAFFEKWGRRSVTVPSFIIICLLLLALLPVTLPIAALVDAIRGTQWGASRFLLFLCLYFSTQTFSILLALVIWVFSGRWLGLGKKLFVDWSYTLQRWYGSSLFYGTVRLYGIRLKIDEPPDLNRGPLMLFIRHASLPDTSLPGALFILRHRMRIRHIMKRELLWDPALDIGGNRIPNYFLRRKASDPEKELAEIRQLARDMTANEGIMIYPEGTRFTQAKRNKMIQSLAQKGKAALAEKAAALKNVRPPRVGGSLAILEGNNMKAYAVFCAHIGFEAASKMVDLLNGTLINSTIRVKLWKVPFDQIPKTREERIEWLFENWKKIDDWIELHKNFDSMSIQDQPVTEPQS